MKIYIHTDLEGISGIDNAEMVSRENPQYQVSVQRLMSDVNAAVEGAFAGGATHITVLDSHGGGGNFDLSLLDKRVHLDLRKNNKWWGELDDTYAGTLFIGAHAMAGTINGFLDHTQSSKAWYNYWVNGRRMGELAQWAMVAGHFGVPMLMVSGDDAACAEAREFFNPIECVSVKRGIGRNNAQALDIDLAKEQLYNTAYKAMSLIGKAKSFTPIIPMEVKLELYRSDFCDKLACIPGVERLDARTVRKVVNNYLDLLF